MHVQTVQRDSRLCNPAECGKAEITSVGSVTHSILHSPSSQVELRLPATLGIHLQFPMMLLCNVWYFLSLSIPNKCS